MKYKRGLLTLFVALLAFWSMPALAIRLVSIQLVARQAGIVLPLLDNETASQALQRYRNALQTRPWMRNLLSRSEPIAWHIESAAIVENTDLLRAPTALIVDNFDYLIDHPRTLSTTHAAQIARAKPYFIPVAAQIGLSDRDKKQFKGLLQRNFAMAFLLGGADLDPDIYGQPATDSYNVNPERDRYNLEIARWFIEARRLVVGICKGMQTLWTIPGGQLDQDISAAGGLNTNHANPVTLDSGNWLDGVTLHVHYHDIIVKPSFLADSWGGPGVYPVTSSHHQRTSGTSPGFKVVATHPDGTYEAIESYDRRIFGFQFHFEIEPSLIRDRQFRVLAPKLFSNLVEHGRQLVIQDEKICRGLF